MSTELPPLNPLIALVTLCEDVFFGITAIGRLDLDLLRALAARRAAAHRAAALGSPGPALTEWEPWLLTLCAATAPIAPPRWMPMAEVVEAGLSLEHGARGVRSFFTSKPSEKEIMRVRTTGAFAVRVLASVLGAAGQWSAESRLLRAALVASLGLPEDDARVLNNEAPFPSGSLELHGGCDGKVARAMVRGAFYAAMGDGMDPREEQAIAGIAYKLGLDIDTVNAARTEARDQIEAARDFGEACVDAVRFMLDGDAAASERYGIAAARLALPSVSRREAITAINVGGPALLAKKHKLDRRQREAVLGLGWIMAVHTNPTITRRAELATRHTRIAADLGDESEAIDLRMGIDRLIEVELNAAMVAAATT
ncbi:MAG: hypothetical protein ABJE95_19720 [Byssovorax sp.]